MKRKLNPFVVDCEASATQETMLKGEMPSERMRGLDLPKPLSLEQCVALLTSPPGSIQDHTFYETDTHPTITSSNSDSGKPHATLHDHVALSTDIPTYRSPTVRTVVPGKLGETLLSRANTFPCKRESVTHRFDCNTVGPVSVASGYGSSLLTHSAQAR